MTKPIPAPREQGYTSSTETPLFFARYGKPGNPLLMILHGGPGADHCYLLPQMLHLAERYELLFYDQRGGGKSRGDARAPVTWQMQVEDVGGIAAEFGLAPLSIVGYSWGAMLALLYAAEATEHNSLRPPGRLVLIDPAPVTRDYRRTFEQEFARRQQAPAILEMRDELASSGLRETNPAAYRQRVFELGVAGYFADPRSARDLTPFRVVGRVQQSVWESLGDFDLLPRLTRIHCPALVVHGRDDPIPLESSTRTADALGARLVVLDDCGHVPYVEQEAALFSAVDSFLGETDFAGS